MLADKLDRLFERYRSRDDGHALARVFDLISSDLYRFALHLCRDGETAEDLIQATFLVAIERRDAYVPQGKLFSWLAGILGNEFRRRQRRAGREIDSTRLAIRVEPDVSDSVADAEAARRVQNALADVPEPYRGVLELSLNEDLEAAAIADRLHRPRGTVRAQLSRGRELIRRLLPAGIAGLLVALFPRSSHAAVREAVLVKAGFSPTTGLASVAALEIASAAAVVVAVVGLGVVALNEEEEHGLDEAVRVESGAGEVAATPIRRSAPDEVRSQGEGETAQRVVGEPEGESWRWKLSPVAARNARESHRVTSLRSAELPEGLAGRHFLARSAVPYSRVVQRAEFDELRPWAGEALELPGLPVDRLALVFFEGVSWGKLGILRTASPTNDVRGGNASIAAGFSITPDKALDLSAPPVGLLVGQEGVVRKAFRRSGKKWVLEETAPLPLEVELKLAGGLELSWMLERADGRLSVKNLLKKTSSTIVLVEAETGRPVTGAEVLLDSGSVSLPLTDDGGGRFVVPPVVPRRGGASILVRAPGRLTQYIRLDKLGRSEARPLKVELVRSPAAPSRLLHHDGSPLADARIRFRTTTSGEECLGAATDGSGWFTIFGHNPSRKLGGSRALVLDGDLEGHVETADGRTGRIPAVALRDLLAGTTVRLAPETGAVMLRVTDRARRPVGEAFITVSGTGVNDERLHAFESRSYRTDDEGLCRIGSYFGRELTITVESAGRLREVHTRHVPDDGMVDLVLDAVEELTIRLVPNVEGIDLSRWTTASVTCEGESRIWDSLEFDASGKATIGVSAKESFRVALNLSHGRRTDGRVLVPERSVFEHVTAGADLRIPVTVCRSVNLNAETSSADGRPRAAVLLVDGDRPSDDVSAWEHRRDGMGGYWQLGYPVTVPLGAPMVTMVMPGHRPLRFRARDGVDELEIRLMPGVTASGVVEGVEKRSRLAATLLEVDGVSLPRAWNEYLAKLAGHSAVVGEGGEFTFGPMIPGRYRMQNGEKSVVLDLTEDRSDLVLRFD